MSFASQLDRSWPPDPDLTLAAGPRIPQSIDRAPRAGDGNRTHVACLEGRYSTIELHPPGRDHRRYAGPKRRRPSELTGQSWGHCGRRERVARASDPTRDPFPFRGNATVPRPSDLTHGWSRIRTCEGSATRFTVWPLWPLGYPPGSTRNWRRRSDARPALRLVVRLRRDRESFPSRSGRAGGESRTHNRRFTKPVLCRLSYASNQVAVKFPNIPSPPSHARAFSPLCSKSVARLKTHRSLGGFTATESGPRATATAYHRERALARQGGRGREFREPSIRPNSRYPNDKTTYSTRGRPPKSAHGPVPWVRQRILALRRHPDR